MPHVFADDPQLAPAGGHFHGPADVADPAAAPGGLDPLFQGGAGPLQQTADLGRRMGLHADGHGGVAQRAVELDADVDAHDVPRTDDPVGTGDAVHDLVVD